MKILWFVNSSWPWVARGGDYNHGTSAGVFDFNNNNGHAINWLGFRVVLAFTMISK